MLPDYRDNLYNEKFGVIIRDYLQRSTIGSGISWEGNDLFCSLHLCDWILIKSNYGAMLMIENKKHITTFQRMKAWK